MCTFSHLHCHSQYSLLDGAAAIPKMIKKAANQGMPAIALTDHGNMFGVPSFVKEAEKNNIKPIIGSEFYITPTRMGERDNRLRYHQLLLAKNKTGYYNLVRLSSLGYIEGLYYKPRIDKETLEKYSEGLIATTCCLQSEINQTILKAGEGAAKKLFEWYLELFGEDYYIELQRHGLRDQEVCNEVLIRWSREYGVKMIATNDTHYVDKQDSEAHDILLALQTNADINDPNRLRFTGDDNRLNTQFYLKTADEMKELFSDIPESIENTAEIVEKVEPVKINSELLLPHFKVPDGFGGMDEYLRHMTMEGAKKRYASLSQDILERLDRELQIIKKMGFAGYFLIVEGFTTEARKRGVYVGPGRGSAAGSLVAYCIGIINIDPLKYGLLFERFLNPERISPPDIDIDFDDGGRQELIDYVVEKYGRDTVAQIVTYGTMKAKTAIRDVGRILGVPLSEVNRIAKLIPEKPGQDTFETAMNPEINGDTALEIKALFEHPESQIKRMMKYAKTLEGCARHTGIHAAGVIIAPGPVYQYVPVALSKEKDVITQYDGPSAEMCGLLKMDFLGLKTLSILKTAIRLVKEETGKEYDLDDIPLDDEKTFELYQRGDTTGTFQFESDGMRKYLRELKPTSINDLIAMNALYRPGPMQFIPEYIKCKNGEKKITYPHPMLEEVLKPTYGIMVYQEQIMKVAQLMGGFTLGQADILRRIMSKKKTKEMKKMKILFMKGAEERKVDKKCANEVFEKMAYFSGYGFNKSHSAAYSVVAYHTAYFKAHYPAPYMAAVLTHNMNEIKKVTLFIEECYHLGIPVDPPDINKGEAFFAAKEGRVQYGLSAIKGVGSSAVEHLVNERKKNGEYESFYDFTKRVDLRSCNRRMIESLIAAGAFDMLHKNRAQLMENLDDALSYGARVQGQKNQNQISLFDGENATSGDFAKDPKMKDAEPWSNLHQLKQERELIGFFLSGHPLDRYQEDIRLFCTNELGEEGFKKIQDRNNVICAGIITAARHTRDKKGRPMAFITIEDQKGSTEIIVFSECYDQAMNLLQVDNVVVVNGAVSLRDGTPKIIAGHFDRIENLREKNQKAIRLSLNMIIDDLELETIEKIANLFKNNPGRTQVRLIVTANKEKPLSLKARKFVVDPTDALLTEARKLLGKQNVWLEKNS